MLVLVSVRTATTIDHPESVNGMLKSTLPILLAVIVTSPGQRIFFSPLAPSALRVCVIPASGV